MLVNLFFNFFCNFSKFGLNALFGVIVNPTKSHFRLLKLQFLGHVVTAYGIKPIPSKVEAIQKYPLPKKVKQLRSYLGMINFYHRCVESAQEVHER